MHSWKISGFQVIALCAPHSLYRRPGGIGPRIFIPNTTGKVTQAAPACKSEPAVASIYGTTPYQQTYSFLIIGERLNATGSKRSVTCSIDED